MNTTQPHPTALASFSDLEVLLFGTRTSPAANASAYIDAVGPVSSAPPANVRPFLPDPPSRGNGGAIVESVLLRAA